MRKRHWGVVLGGTFGVVGAIAACVGDDPSPSNVAGSDDAANTETSVSLDGNGGTDSPVTDGGADGCATANLTNDPRNCGACGRDCMSGMCSGSVCQPWVVSAFDGGTPLGPGTDGTHVYYSINTKVWRVQIDGGAPVQMTSGLDAKAFAKGPTGMLACGALGADIGVFTLPTVPGASPTLLQAVAACTALVVDGTTVWAGRLTSIDEITGAGTTAHSTAIFSERVTGGIASGTDRFYWVNQNGGVFQTPKATFDTGHAVLNSSAINEPNGIAVSDKLAYVTARPAGAGGILLSVALDGGAPNVLLTGIPQSAFQQGVARAPNGALYFAAGDTIYGYVPPP